MSSDSAAIFKQMVTRHLKRPWSPSDGIESARMTAAEVRGGLTFPEALRALYQTIGALPAFCTIHNKVRAPEDVAVESEHLVFMDENQGVVSWGVRVMDIGHPDPVVWQRNNTPPEAWFSEEKTLTALFESMLNWYSELGVWSMPHR